MRDLLDGVLADLQSTPGDAPVDALLERRLQRLRRAGSLPLGGLADRAQARLAERLLPLLYAWQQAQADHAGATERLPLYCTTHPSNAIEIIADSAIPVSAEGTFYSNSGPAPVVLEDWLEPLRCGPDGLPVWLDVTPSRLLQDARKGTVRADALLVPWVRSLAAAASGAPVHGLLVGRDATLHCTPLAHDSARATLVHLLQVWRGVKPLDVSLFRD